MPVEDKLKALALAQLAAIDRDRSQLTKKEHFVQYGGGASPDDYAEFNSKCLAAIDRILHRHDSRYEQALREIERHSALTDPELARTLYGLVRAIKRDVTDGSLVTFCEIAYASVYTELLELADWQLSQGHVNEAAIMIVSVLETHLRHLAAKYDIRVSAINPTDGTGRTTPQQVNDELAQVAYGQAEREIVAAWLRLAASASARAGQMSVFAAQLRGFIARYPA